MYAVEEKILLSCSLLLIISFFLRRSGDGDACVCARTPAIGTVFFFIFETTSDPNFFFFNGCARRDRRITPLWGCVE